MRCENVNGLKIGSSDLFCGDDDKSSISIPKNFMIG
jgi:hypothetical protein